MSKKRITLLATVVLGLAAARSLVPVAFAAPHVDPAIKQTVQLLVMMETDPNGKVSKAEFMKFMEAQFDKLDKNKDGELDVKEFTQTPYYVHTGSHR